MSKITYDENGKVDESKLTTKQIKNLNATNKAIVLGCYKKILKTNKSPIIQARYDYLHTK